MIKGATTFVNKWTGEIKQKCVCGASLPLRYNVHLGCKGKKVLSPVISKEETLLFDQEERAKY